MRRWVVCAAALVFLPVEANAQDWVPWHRDSPFYSPKRRPGVAPQPVQPPRGAQRRQNIWLDNYDDDDAPPAIKQAPAILDGGARPSISAIPPQQVSFRGYATGSIVIDTGGRKLYLVTSSSTALRYPIAVGRIGFTWTGTERISRIANWPDWHPPKEMRERDPSLPEKMTGGIRNPLGAVALYLGSSLYRIHGTNDARSIGSAGSSGCFRMLNGHAIDLAGRVGVGATVHVLSRLPASAYAEVVGPPVAAQPKGRRVVVR